MASDLISGTYSKKIVFTSITNYVPKTATFISGQSFNNIVKKLNTNYDTEIKPESVEMQVIEDYIKLETINK